MPSTQPLEALLREVAADYIHLRAPWAALTGDVFQSLASWAAEDPERGFGVACPDTVATRLDTPRPSACALLVEPDRARRLDGDGARPIAHDVARDMLSSEAPPVVAVITGHGGEHCISFGSDWVSTTQATGLPGDRFDPEAVRSPIVFLNTCGSLRMGDSVVPKTLSLAATLAARGIAVVGAFRNQFTFPEAAEWFAQWILQGVPVGEAVARLNRESRTRGNITASYVLLGDPALAFTSEEGASLVASPLALDPPPEVSLDEIVEQDNLHRTIAAWSGPVAEATRSNPRLDSVLDTCIKASHAARLRLITPAEAEQIEQFAAAEVAAARAGLVDALVAASGKSIWPQQMYAAIARPVRCALDTCIRCGRVAVRHEFEPWRRGLLTAYGLECDGCGTVSDVVGPGVPQGLSVRLEGGGALVATVPRLPTGAEGRIAVYRAPDLAPVRWPSEGGEVAFALDEIPFRGKTTLVAAHAVGGALTAEYATIFTET